MNLHEAKIILARERVKLRNEKRDVINNFRNEINKLIQNTPTGELRNTITDLNILFEQNLSLEEDLKII